MIESSGPPVYPNQLRSSASRRRELRRVLLAIFVAPAHVDAVAFENVIVKLYDEAPLRIERSVGGGPGEVLANAESWEMRMLRSLAAHA
ncbi:MAG: hypothetical protein JNL18_01730 [Planctomycetaceae bacterium]|nr:hypothetical protein [Planctomycetaceae bacterium]